MQISIKTLKGKSINLEFEDSSETIDIKIHGEPVGQVVLSLGPGLGPDPRQGQDEAMKISLLTLGGKNKVLEVKGSETIAQVMTKIHEKRLGPQVRAQRLFFQGIELDSNRTVADYNIKNDSDLVLMTRLCGC